MLKMQNEGQSFTTYPTNKFFLKVDTTAVKQLGIVPTDRRHQFVAEMRWTMGRAIEKKEPGDSRHDCDQQLEAAHLLQLHSDAYRLLPLRAPRATKRGKKGYVEKTSNTTT